jgi:diguanylate cyclase (GGDEF)-like protein
VSQADELRDELQLLREAIKSFPDALAVRDAEGRLIAVSELYARLAPADGPLHGEFQSADGRWLRRSLRRLAGGGSVELVADVTELRRAEQAARFLGYHDASTGLPNRRLFDDRLRQAIHMAQRRDRMAATLLIRIDDYDKHGQGEGEALLREAARRLAACLRKADTLARAGVGEFAAVIGDLKQPADCRVVVERLQQALPPGLSASIGVSMFPADGADAEALLRNADAAVFSARQAGRNRAHFFGR